MADLPKDNESTLNPAARGRDPRAGGAARAVRVRTGVRAHGGRRRDGGARAGRWRIR